MAARLLAADPARGSDASDERVRVARFRKVGYGDVTGRLTLGSPDCEGSEFSGVRRSGGSGRDFVGASEDWAGATDFCSVECAESLGEAEWLVGASGDDGHPFRRVLTDLKVHNNGWKISRRQRD
ncbi:unnamed protein product [Dibothriocephalus latus]|uniref:Uncharacterized protein n=1 Tax=Dibothriocephalus latus TaxID=60516 RepID=A0A3P7PIY7_DIBLA|nr:unnamed protein product [Dibothriocephalus latus]